jgi:hypothetical protein
MMFEDETLPSDTLAATAKSCKRDTDLKHKGVCVCVWRSLIPHTASRLQTLCQHVRRKGSFVSTDVHVLIVIYEYFVCKNFFYVIVKFLTNG